MKTTTTEKEQKSSEGMNEELHKLFLDELADVYDAENQLVNALPKMIKAAQSEELREAITAHLKETEGHVTRLEEAANTLDEKLKSKTCKAMKGLLAEGDEIVKENKGSSALDAGIIAAAQKVEHYEIASYGTLIAWAKQMGHIEAAELLDETLNEEKAADTKLSEIAETVVAADAD